MKQLVHILLGILVFGRVVTHASFAVEPVRCIDHAINLSFVKGKVGDVELTFLLDSGAGFNVICTSVLDSIAHSDPQYSEIYPDIQVIDALDVTVAGYRSTIDAPTTILDLRPIAESSGFECDGILGMPFLVDKSLVFTSHGVYLSDERQHKEPIDVGLPCHADEFGCLYVNLESFGDSLEGLPDTLIDTGMNNPLSICAETFNLYKARRKLVANAIHAVHLVFVEDRIVSRSVPTGTITCNLFGPCASVRMAVSAGEENSLGWNFLYDLGGRVDFKSKVLFLRLPGSQSP